jgi:hypothetical protein
VTVIHTSALQTSGSSEIDAGLPVVDELHGLDRLGVVDERAAGSR